MRSEMPVKYWRNLPETRLIPEMLADAPRRVQAMAAAGASTAPARAARITARIRPMPDDTLPDTLQAACAQARHLHPLRAVPRRHADRLGAGP